MHVLKKKFFNHPLLKKDKLEYRFYQETIVGACSNKNSLIVLPTGLGKTIIAILVSVIKLNKIKGSKVIFLAPTKPLIQQHYETYKTFLNLDPDQMALLTGTIPPDKRLEMINYARIYFYTPQTLQNDIINNRIDLSDVSLIIFDEAHRAVGNYAYVFIADKYMKNAKNPQILAITASPGSEKEKISEIIDNLYIEKIEVRTEDSPDVKPYIQPIEINWRKIDLPVEFMEIKSILEDNLRKCILYLYSNSLLNTKNINNIT
ncbi:MAG: DEAD/DEAH box helicase, partial [Candidatus Helarchaeota archaeon]